MTALALNIGHSMYRFCDKHPERLQRSKLTHSDLQMTFILHHSVKMQTDVLKTNSIGIVYLTDVCSCLPTLGDM